MTCTATMREGVLSLSTLATAAPTAMYVRLGGGVEPSHRLGDGTLAPRLH